MKGSLVGRNRSPGRGSVFRSVERGRRRAEDVLGEGLVRRRSNEREIEEQEGRKCNRHPLSKG